MSPIINEWGSKEARIACRDVLDVLTEGRHQIENASDMILRLESLPESSEDDSQTASYYVMRAVGVLYYCVGAIAAETPIEHTQSACFSLLDLARDVSFVCSEVSQNTRSSDVTEMYTSTLVSTIELLDASSLDSEGLSAVQNFARNLAKTFEDALPSVAQVHGWGRNGDMLL